MMNCTADHVSALCTKIKTTLEAQAEEAYLFLSWTPALHLIPFLLLPFSLDVFSVKNTHSTPTQAYVFP